MSGDARLGSTKQTNKKEAVALKWNEGRSVSATETLWPRLLILDWRNSDPVIASNKLVYKSPEEPGYSITTAIRRRLLLGVVDSYSLAMCPSDNFLPLLNFKRGRERCG